MVISRQSCEWLTLKAIEIIGGLIFITSAALQAAAIQLFVVNLTVYDGLRDPSVIRMLSVIIINIEILLGFNLLSGARLGPWSHFPSILCVASLNGYILYSRLFIGTRQCLCYGYQVTSVRFCILLTALIVISLVFAFVLCFRERKAPESEKPRRFLPGRLALAVIPLVVVFNVGLYVNSVNTEDQSFAAEECNGRPLCGLSFHWKEKDWELSHGTFVVVLFETNCNHCKESVEAFNSLGTELPEEIPLVGVSIGTQDSLDEFKMEMEPDFPLLLIGPLRFYSLLEEGVPQLMVVHDGGIHHSWEIEIPSTEEILESLADLETGLQS